jgi:DHA1 family bicyclomycin/chloramphenicol resistance-like MFS transporter
MAFSAAVLMTFVTNSSFLYMEYFGVAASRFPWLFAASVLGVMSTNLFSMWRLNSDNAGTFFRAGLTVQLLGVVALMLVVAGGEPPLAAVVTLLVLTVATLGLVGPAGSSRYMGYFRELAGSASSVYTTVLFFLGGGFGWLGGWLTGLQNERTLVPIVATMLVASLTANLISLGLLRPAPRPAP